MTTQETIKKAVDYAKENNIKNIVVATTTGGNLTYLEDEKDLHIVGVTNAYDQGQNQMREEVRKHFEEAGMDIVTAGHALSGAERCFSTYFGGYGPDASLQSAQGAGEDAGTAGRCRRRTGRGVYYAGKCGHDLPGYHR